MQLLLERTWCSFPKRTLVLGFLTLALLPGFVTAETIEVRNDTKATIIIQTACIVNDNVRRERPVTLRTGAKISIKLHGNKLITVYDASMPNRVLHQSTIASSKEDGTYSLQPDTKTGRLQLSPVKKSKERK